LANALKLALNNPVINHNYQKLIEIIERTTPEMYSKYKVTIQMYKTINNNEECSEWIHLNCDQILTSRQKTIMIMKLNFGKNDNDKNIS
jgi:hypothetical protein